MMSRTIAWDDGVWEHQPPSQRAEGGSLVVAAREGSDAWVDTYYGFVHDSAHALLVPAPTSAGFEVSFLADYDQLYDQAGLMITADGGHWVKSGVEISDGVPQVGAVVTGEAGSDWSAAPVPAWAGREVTIRASLDRGAVILRARVDAEPWQFLRLAPLPAGSLRVGPYLGAPTRPGLSVTFTGFVVGDPDPQLHLEDP